jgi:hypothetical protein
MTTMLGDFDLERLLDALRWQESRGNNNAVSPAGAKGAYQFMKPTWEDPGYGVPAKAGGTWENFLKDESLQRKTAGEYLTAMHGRTGDVPSALAAYNGGLGRGLAFKRGGGVPAETANYVPSVLDHYKRGTGTGTPRERFDAIVAQRNGQQPMSLGQQPDMVAEGLAANEAQEPLPMTQSGASMGADFLSGPGATGIQNPGMPQRLAPEPQLTPEENAAADADAPPVDPAAAAGIDPEIAKYFDMIKPKQDRWSGMGGALMAIGGGLMESGGMKGMGAAGRGAGEALATSRALDIKQRETEAENFGPTMAYQMDVSNGMDPKRAFLKNFVNRERIIPAGFDTAEDGVSLKPTKGGPHDPETISRASQTRAEAQVKAINESDEVKDVVTGIEEGNLPPSTTGMYRYGVAVKAQLAKKGFNFAKAALEYKTAERQISGLNAPRMTMFVGLANSVLSTMDRVKALSKDMQNSGLTGYNKAKLEVLMHTQGNTPQGQLATQYIAAVNTLKEEFANLATGGYAPTEAAWKLADDQVNGNFGVDQMNASIDELKRLINYRLQAVPGLMERGPGGANRYTGQKQQELGDTGHGPAHGGGSEADMPPVGLAPEDAEAWATLDAAGRAEMLELYGLE